MMQGTPYNSDYSQETLRYVEDNDHRLVELGITNNNRIIDLDIGRYFTSSNGDDYSRLGNCIGRNTHLKTLYVELRDIRLSATHSGFFEGVKQNSSIREFKMNDLSYYGGQNYPIGEVGCEVLKVFQSNNNLTTLSISSYNIRNGDERAIINTTLSSCTNLKTRRIRHNNMTDEQLLPMVEAIRGHGSLQELHLWGNQISHVGCVVLAPLLQDPSSNLHTLDIRNNQIGNEGAIAIANSLANNNKLKTLNLNRNEIGIQSLVEDAFSGILCNTSNINSIHSSNHTLDQLTLLNTFEGVGLGRQLTSLLKLNEGTNKKHAAIKKILQHYPNIDTEPLFEWDSGDERNLMALPYVVDWFDRAEEAVEDVDERLDPIDDSSDSSVSNDSDDYDYKVEEKKLTTIYEFALAMPLLTIPTSHSHINTDDKKRKRAAI